MSENKEEQNLSKQINNLRRSGEFNKALEISEQVLKFNPPDLKAYSARWGLMTEMCSEADAKERIYPEIEMVLRTHPESPELYYTVYMRYKHLPGGAKNVPKNIFDKMLKYPGTKTYLSALFGLAEQNEDEYQKWHYYQRVINECTVTDGPSTWYMLGYKNMLGLVEKDRSLADDDYIDELIDGLLNAHLYYCRESQQPYEWAYRDVVKLRIRLNIRLDKALKTLDRAEIRLGEKEEQEWMANNSNKSVANVQRKILRLRAEVYYQQERWCEAYDGLNATAPNFQDSLSERFNSEGTTNYFYMLGRSAEGIGNWEKAQHYYCEAYFALTPHSYARAGLKRVYQQIKRSNPSTTFEEFLKDTETEYQIREEAFREHIRQKMLSNKINEKAADFRLETLDGESYTLSDMSGKVVMLDVSATWCGFCSTVIPDLKLIYNQFSKDKDFIIWGINDGETPQKAKEFVDEHQQPWPVLLDPHRVVSEAYKIDGLPYFIFIDKKGYWQYRYDSADLTDGQPLIWLIEALLSD